MEIWQVIMVTTGRDYIEPERNFVRETDLGLFQSLEEAYAFIEKYTKNQIDASMNDGDPTWISAYPKEDPIDGYDNVGFVTKSILTEDRKEGQFICLDYLVKRRIIKGVA